MSIFSDYSTFVLRSSEYYKRHYETDRGDECELEAECTNGDWASSSGFVLSCWTILGGAEPARDEWRIFRDSVVAIISTPDRVCTMLEGAFELENVEMRDRRRFPFMFVKHKGVTYLDKVAEKITQDNIMDVTVFTKRARFAKQNEYRFALPYSMTRHVIDSYVFATSPDDYMVKCCVNPEMCREQKKSLRLILLQATAGYGHFGNKRLCDIIANEDVLF